MTFGSLFAGIGGFDLGFERAGMRCVWQVEIDEYCRRVLAKHWPDVPKWDDVKTFTGEGFERPDVICGGFPCQDISNAGKRAGIDGERSGLWSEYARIVRELRPEIVVVENVSGLSIRGIGRVLGDLAESGYDAEWDGIRASDFGAPHRRERVFIVAHADEIGRGDASFRPKTFRQFERSVEACFRIPQLPEPAICGVDDGIPNRVDRLAALGNAVVPTVAEWIGRRLMETA